MTPGTNARLAGFAFLCYIAVGIAALVLFRRVTGAPGGELAATLASIAEHESEVRIVLLLSLLACFSALVLGVTLYGLTRHEDPELALLGLTCRVAEGLLGGVALMGTLGLIWLATAARTLGAEAGGHALAGYFLATRNWSPIVSAMFFAVGSTLFSWLFLRGRMIPAGLAWLGVVASVLLVAVLPLQLGGVVSGALTRLIWLPMLLYELVLAGWLLTKGVVMPATR